MGSLSGLFLIPALILPVLRLRLRVDVDDHSGALVAVVCTFELLEHERRGIVPLVAVTEHKALLDEVEALGCFSLMLLADVLRGVTEASFLEEIELGPLEETRIPVVFVCEQELHGLLDLGDSQLIQLIDRVFLLL